MGGPPRLKIPTSQQVQTVSPSIFNPEWLPKRLLNDLLTSTFTFPAFESVADTKFHNFRPRESSFFRVCTSAVRRPASVLLGGHFGSIGGPLRAS